jgi:hypothetical protein
MLHVREAGELKSSRDMLDTDRVNPVGLQSNTFTASNAVVVTLVLLSFVRVNYTV